MHPPLNVNPIAVPSIHASVDSQAVAEVPTSAAGRSTTMPVPSEVMLIVGLKFGGSAVSACGTLALVKSPEYSAICRRNCWLRLVPCALTWFTIVWR